MQARFVGGEFDGARLSITAPYTPTTLYVVRAPNAADLDVLIVGTDKMAPGPLLKAALYQLDRSASDLRDHPEFEGMEVGVAIYREEARPGVEPRSGP